MAAGRPADAQCPGAIWPDRYLCVRSDPAWEYRAGYAGARCRMRVRKKSGAPVARGMRNLRARWGRRWGGSRAAIIGIAEDRIALRKLPGRAYRTHAIPNWVCRCSDL